MNRKEFIKTAALGAAAVGVGLKATDDIITLKDTPTEGRYARLYPILHGDGIQDDTEAIQALVDGERVLQWWDGKIIQAENGQIELPSKTFKVTGPLTFPPTPYIRSTGLVAPSKAVFQFNA